MCGFSCNCASTHFGASDSFGSSFSVPQVEEFFNTLAAQLEDTDQFYFQDELNIGYSNLAEDTQVTEDDADFQQVDASFSQLLSKTDLLFNQSLTLVRKMEQVLGESFLLGFIADLQPGPLSNMQVGSSPGFFRTLGLGPIVDSVYHFGKNVMGEISSSVSDAFEDELSQQPIRGNEALKVGGINVLFLPRRVLLFGYKLISRGIL